MRSNGFLSRLSCVPPIGKPARRRRRRRSPRLESLEGRLVLSSLTVTSAADSGTGTLRAVIAQAQAGDTITFSSRLDGQTISLTGGELAIDENLTIEGPGAGLIDVDAGGKNRVFDITSASATVTISGLTISGGNSEDGGGIVDQGGTLTLTGDALSKDEAIGVNPGDTVQGGAVEVTDSGTLTVSSSRFVEDLAQGAAGANGGTAPVNGTGGDGDGGAIFADVGTSLTVTGCTFTGNQAIGGAGGGGFENGAGGNGNGSAIDTSGVAFSVTDSTFKGDLALGGAGATGLAAQPYTFNGTGGGASGTIIIGSLIADSPFTFSGDTFSGEQAIGGEGANSTGPGFANYGGAGGGAGGIINNNDGIPDMTIQNCTFTHNLGQAGAGGSSDFGGEGGNGSGALIFTGGNLTIVGSTFTGNQAIGGVGGSGGAGGGGYGGFSGAVVFVDGNLTLSNSTFTDNLAIAGAGGAAGAGGDGGPGGVSTGGAIFVYAQLSVSGSTFLDNESISGAGGDGGAGGAGGAGGLSEGGAIDVQGFPDVPPYLPPFPLSTIASSRFVGNASIGGKGGDGGQGGDSGDGGSSTGGDIVSFGNLSITSSTFLLGRAQGGAGGSGVTGGDGGAGQGGSLYLIDTAYGFPPLAFTDTVTGSTVIGAVAEGGPGGSGGPSGTGGAGGLAQGGGIAVSLEGNGTFQVTVSESAFSANAAIGGDGGSGSVGGDGGDAEGGGLFVDPYSTVALDDDVIIGNVAEGGSGATNGTGSGGGVYLSTTGSTRKNTTIAGNWASSGDNDVYGSFD
jgi:hypothetical protein